MVRESVRGAVATGSVRTPPACRSRTHQGDGSTPEAWVPDPVAIAPRTDLIAPNGESRTTEHCLTAPQTEAYNLLEKRGELRRLAATQNKRLNSSASSKNEPKKLQTELKSRVV